MSSENHRNKKMREKIERRKRYLQQKAFSDAMKRNPSSDPDLTERQRTFCIKIIKGMLEDDQCYSFSKPVTELWDMSELPDYFEKVPRPMDLGTIMENLERNGFKSEGAGCFDFRKFIKDVHLVFQNCLAYNEKTTDLAKLSRRLMAQFDRQVREIPIEKYIKANKNEGNDGKDSDAEGGKDEMSDGGESGHDDGKEAASGDEQEPAAPSSERAQEQDEIDRLARKLTVLKKLKAKSEGALAEIEMERNMPMTADERIALRDEVESADWAIVERVGTLLSSYVRKAIDDLKRRDTSAADDPEYVMLELNEIENSTLRAVEDLVATPGKRNASQRLDLERGKINKINSDIEEAETQLRSIKRRRV